LSKKTKINYLNSYIFRPASFTTSTEFIPLVMYTRAKKHHQPSVERIHSWRAIDGQSTSNSVRKVLDAAHFFRCQCKIKNPQSLTASRIFLGRSVIIGFQKTQIYQRFAGSRQEVFILKIQNDESNAAQQDNGRRFHI